MRWLGVVPVVVVAAALLLGACRYDGYCEGCYDEPDAAGEAGGDGSGNDSSVMFGDSTITDTALDTLDDATDDGSGDAADTG
jgi:hypothetical protein